MYLVRIRQNQYSLLLNLNRKTLKNLGCRNIQIKQHSKVEYLRYLTDETMFGEAKELNVIHKINNKPKFLYCKNVFFDTNTESLCNPVMQPYFDYICTAWYPNLTKKFKQGIQTTQNKFMHFYMQLDMYLLKSLSI